MAAKRHCWQSFNFPFSEQEIVSHSFLDYGCSSLSNIDLDEDGKTVVIYPKKSHNSRLRLEANHPSLPFSAPNSPSCSLSLKTVVDGNLRDDAVSEISSNHLSNFSTYHPDVMYGTVSGLLQEELNCYPWGICGNIRRSIDLYSPWNRKEAYCKICSKLSKASQRRKGSGTQAILQQLKTSLSDISPSLLDDLLQESITSELSQFHFDLLMGNSLACHSLDAEQQAILLYPSGSGLDVLNFAKISQFAKAAGLDDTLFCANPILTRQQFALQGGIKQIDFSSHSSEDIVVGIRSQYNCSFFQSYPNYNSSTDGNLPPVKLLETVALTKQAVCLTVSPYVPGEGIVVTETGRVHSWRCGRELHTVCSATEQFNINCDSGWYQCVFAGNSQCIALANPKAVLLVDFRAGAMFKKFFFSIPSSKVDSFECITSIQRHPQNCHHYFLATDQSLMVLDDRYLQHPVLKWRHHIEDPVQFIDITCNAIPDCDDTVVLTSGSKHHQTHCFQYSGAKGRSDRVLNASIGQTYVPPTSTCLPWKVCSYSDWYYSGLSKDLNFSQATALRVSQPLIGVCSMPHTSHPHRGFTVFQMSSVGDLFYQSFFAQETRDDENVQLENKQQQELHSEAKVLCQKWIDVVDQGMGDIKETRECERYFEEGEYKRDLCLDLLSLPEPHSSCTLCNDRQIEEIDDSSEDSGICERCGLDVSFSCKLVEHQKSCKVLTRSSLGIRHELMDLQIYPDISKATDPLSKSLMLNWNSDEPIPIDMDGLGYEPHASTDGPMVATDAKAMLTFSEVLLQSSNKNRTANDSKPVLLPTDIQALMNDVGPVLSDRKPLLIGTNRTMLVKGDGPMPEMALKEDENKSSEDKSEMNPRLPPIQYQEGMQFENSPRTRTLQNQDSRSSHRKRKQSSRVMGF